MQIPIIILSILLALVFLAVGVAKVMAHPMMREAAAAIGFSVTTYRAIGLLEIAGAAGLVVGLFWAPLGIAAAAGCLLLLAGATYFHLRSKDSLQEMSPALFCGALAVALLVLYAFSA